MKHNPRFAYRSKDAWIMYWPDSLIRAIWYPEPKKKLITSLDAVYNIGLEKDALDGKAGAIELFYSPIDYYAYCHVIFGEKAAGCIMKLIFHAPRAFNCMPKFGKIPKKYIGNQVLYHDVICWMKDEDLVEQSLRIIFSKFKLKNQFEFYVKKQVFPDKNVVLYGMDYSVYAHVLLAPAVFAANVGFLNNMKLERKPSKEIMLGRAFNPATYCDTKTNLYHPDAITKEQLIRWSCVV